MHAGDTCRQVVHVSFAETVSNLHVCCNRQLCLCAGLSSSDCPALGRPSQQPHNASGNIGLRPVSALLRGEAELSDVIEAAHNSSCSDRSHLAADTVLPLAAGYDAVHYDASGEAVDASGTVNGTSAGPSSAQQQPIQEHSDGAEGGDSDSEAGDDADTAHADVDCADAGPDDAGGLGQQINEQDCTADANTEHSTAAVQVSTATAAAARPKAYHLAELPPLDYTKVKAGLQSGQVQLVPKLLQALRWRLTCCESGVERFAVMTGWIEWDLLGMHDAPQGAGSIAELWVEVASPVRGLM